MFLFYVGWEPTLLTPFQNHLGLAIERKDGCFERVSKAPILPRDAVDYLGTGSSCVLIEDGMWRLWYTAFTRWDMQKDRKHSYCIKYAESEDGVCWHKKGTAIAYANDQEYAICRPSVIRWNDGYHMWFCYRGDAYRIGYAYSRDGCQWSRQDEKAGLKVSTFGWDAEMVAYPHVFQYADQLYLLYCGNDFGKQGLGLAVLQ